MYADGASVAATGGAMEINEATALVWLKKAHSSIVRLRLVWASFLGVRVEPRQNVDVAVFGRLVARGGAEQRDIQDAEPLGQRSLMLAKQP